MRCDIDGLCQGCPYAELVYVEEWDNYCCEGLLEYGYCYMAKMEEGEW